MSPPGHAAVAYLLGRAAPRLSAPALIAGAMLPDIDFLLLPFPWFNQVHRVATHNLWFVGAAALLAGALAPAGRGRAVGWSLFLGAVSHLLLDAVMDANPSNGTGVAILWPLYDGFFSPFNLVAPSSGAPTWEHPREAIVYYLSRGLLWEIPVWLLAIALAWRQRVAHARRTE